MKTFFILLNLLGLTGCHKTTVEPEEVKATILSYEVGFVACSGGLRLETETNQVYLAHDWGLPDPYSDYTKVKLPAAVWVRYKDPAGSCSQFPGLIEIVSIERGNFYIISSD